MAITFIDGVFNLRRGEWSDWGRHGACAVQEYFDSLFGSASIGSRRYAVDGGEVCDEGCPLFFVRYAPGTVVL